MKTTLSLNIILMLFSLITLTTSTKSNIFRILNRRQSDSPYCNAIEKFECKCSYYRVTCTTTTHDLSTNINILENEKNKYQAVELVISTSEDIKVNDQTFQTIKQLFKTDADALEFRVKFEKFTSLQLSSSELLNRIFPENLSAQTQKLMALEIYNPEVAPNEDLYLFKNLHVDVLEVYTLYPLHGSFQQLFEGANIKYLRLSGGEIRSDLSKPYNGNIARLEIAKQASTLSVDNFPLYPAHELIINAFYISEFHNANPPNYSNLVELRIYTTERVPANAFKDFSNVQTVSVTTDKDVDRQALSGLNNLEKLIIKESKPSIDIINNLPNLKEFETNIDKLDEDSQCQLITKFTSGQLAVQAISNGHECTCVSAYLNSVDGRASCEHYDCDKSKCPAIKNNYDPSTRTFKAPPLILRSDGTNTLYPRQTKVYSKPYVVLNADREKFSKGIRSQSKHDDDHDYQPSDGQDHQSSDGQDHQSSDGQDHQSSDGKDHQSSDGHDHQSSDGQDHQSSDGQDHQSSDGQDHQSSESHDHQSTDDQDHLPTDDQHSNNQQAESGKDEDQTGKDDENETGKSDEAEDNKVVDNQEDKEPKENQNEEVNPSDLNKDNEQTEISDEKQTSDTSTPPVKTKTNWLPVIIIAIAILLLVIIAIIFIVKCVGKNSGNKGYKQTPNSDTTASAKA